MLLQKVIDRSHWGYNTIHQCYSDFPWDNSKAYATYLAQIFFYVDHATRLLSLGAARCKMNEEKLHLHFIRGIHEEKNHEEMARRDIQALGYDLDEFSELPETSAYYQTLYYMIETDGPTALLGYFIALEGLAAVKMKELYLFLVDSYGKEACTFLEEHCILDQKHFQEGLDFISTCTEAQLETIDKAIVQSTWLYCGIFNRIKGDFKKAKSLQTNKSEMADLVGFTTVSNNL